MLQHLKTYFGYDHFRPLQEAIVSHILSGKDCLVLMPTGGGKSICYQLSALMMTGIAVVVSPLISLMKDQVDGLRANGIEAASLNSSCDFEENLRTRERVIAGKIKILYMSPEKLLAEKDDLLKRFKMSLLAIDEAHCISQWGHDFRPEYAQIGLLRREFPDVPVAAFTATADKVTREDIVKQLGLRLGDSGQPTNFISSFDRPNLSLDVRRGYDSKDRLRTLLRLIERHRHESGIVYCLSRANTEKLADSLVEHGIQAAAYHSGMTAEARDKVQEDFNHDRVLVVCATIAFGMGIDKSNVRFVVHYNMPKSIECYYQEIGRGGRDGDPCETLLFYNLGDIMMYRKFANESGQIDLNLDKLAWMQRYAESSICRRRILLNYFGEVSQCDCGNCDVCKNPPVRFDGSILVQKALSAVYRTGQKAGFWTIIHILRGSRASDVVIMKYDELKTFGVGRDVSEKDWKDYLLQMVQLGYLEVDVRDDAHLKITKPGYDVLYGRAKAELAVIQREDLSVKAQKKKRDGSRETRENDENLAEDEGLFECLRRLRAQIARERKVAAFVVFNDKTLHEMVAKKPISIAAFGDISGVGAHRCRCYGEAFVDAIRAYLHLENDGDANET